MPDFFEPKDGDFEKLTEQLVNQSATSLAIKQNAINQVSLEQTTGKIRSDLQRSAQQINQENTPPLKQAESVQNQRVVNNFKRRAKQSTANHQSNRGGTNQQQSTTVSANTVTKQRFFSAEQHPCKLFSKIFGSLVVSIVLTVILINAAVEIFNIPIMFAHVTFLFLAIFCPILALMISDNKKSIKAAKSATK